MGTNSRDRKNCLVGAAREMSVRVGNKYTHGVNGEPLVVKSSRVHTNDCKGLRGGDKGRKIYVPSPKRKQRGGVKKA